MLKLPGYIPVETLYEGISSLIYRAIKQIDKTAVIVKVLKAEYPTLEELTTLKHEYKILNSLIDVAEVIKPLALENHQNGLALVLEDFGAISLQDFIDSQKIPLKDFLAIAIQLASSLANIHEKKIIHKDIKPQNILINPKNLTIKLIDFSIASQLIRENQTLSSPNFIEGTLAYMSPEQTGRMNRSLDYRTDFYSLGVTFYYMLTGVLPFDSRDPLELIHSHIAKTPASPSEILPEIPLVVSEIIMKLLAKTAEDRYQNALGLKGDLEKCLKQLENNGEIADFKIGQLDLSSQFIIPQKLYGREAEVNTLFNAFERISTGKNEIILVSGYSGIGKTSLVNEVHKPIVRQRGFFISGKFDQFKRNIPYTSLIQAFQELMRQLLTEPPESLAVWKSKILADLGINGQVIIDVIPEVERIIGSQPTVPQLGISESQNRFNRVFQEFIQVFTQPEHPLVLFLDDLQWVDSASLKLIELIMTALDSQYLLLIGAYRDNEVSATHPLLHTLEQIKQTGTTINNIILQPLNIDCVNQLIADTLRSSTAIIKPLAELVFQKTQGNPFFLTQLLKYLYEENLLKFNFSEDIWQWNIEDLYNVNITENVVDLMVSQIQKLPETAIDILKLAACIGDKFTLDVLAIVNEKSLSETAKELWEALHSGLILPLNNSYKIPLVFDVEVLNQQPLEELKVTYKFLHDRVQQASYSLIPEFLRKQTHLKIGELLLKNTSETKLEENIFEIVNQLNIGTELIVQQQQKYELAKLNLIACKKAKAATAYETALKYLTKGIGLLAEDSWKTQYELTLALYIEAVSAEYLNTNFEQAAILAEIVLQQARTLLDKVQVYELQIQFCLAQNQMLKAIDIALQVLEMLDVSLSSLPNDQRLRPQLPQLEDLEDMPAMTDPYHLAALRILMIIVPPAFIADPKIYVQIILTMVNLCIEGGLSEIAAFVYCQYGLVLSGFLKEIDIGYQSGILALRLLDKFKANELKCKIHMVFNTFIRAWKEHINITLNPLIEGFQSGLETGDIAWSGYNAAYYCDHLFFVGESLEVVAEQQSKYLKSMIQLKQILHIHCINSFQRLVLKLLDVATKEYNFYGTIVTDEEVLQELIESKNYMCAFSAYVSQVLFNYLFKNYDAAIANATLASKYAGSAVNQVVTAIHNFYYSLSLLAVARNLPQEIKRKEILNRVTVNQEIMQNWAFHAPCNFQHKYDLVAAEKARTLGQILEAMDFYDRAISGAKEQGYIQEEALANELAAEFYFSQNKNKIARTYLIDAYYKYSRWGATAKVKDLEERYPEVGRISKGEIINNEITFTRTTKRQESIQTLDLATVMKASQALSGEIVLSKLLTKLMQIVLENAGAQTGLLILETDGNLLIEAQAEVKQEKVTVLRSQPVATSKDLPISVINYVARTHEDVLLNHTTSEGIFAADPYIVNRQPKSLLCTPLLHQGKLSGILYLENNLTTAAFTPDRLEILKLLSSQAAISIQNARLYSDLATANATLEAKVQERTQELQEKNVHLQKAEARAKSANRAKSEFLANMSHELRTPLNGILGYAQILQRDKDLTSSQKNGLNIIYQCGNHLLNLINEVLDLSKIEARKMELYPTEFHFSEFLQGIAEICQIRAQQKGISLVYQQTTNLPQGVRADEKRLRQILINLLGNAVKFTEVGEVTLKVGYHNHKIRFQVEDTGVGMAPEQLQEIFLPFHQVGENNRKVEGTGLGLAISCKLVQMMGGEIQVQSTLGKGSIFFFDLDLPEVAQYSEYIKLDARKILKFKGDKQKIIIADDKPENRLILVEILNPLGFETLEAFDGQDCLNKAVEWQPNCILMDLMMPIISGLEATRRLRRSPEIKDIIVIGTSASVFDFDRQTSLEVGCNDFLPKPVRVSELLAKLQSHLGLEWIYQEESETAIHSQSKAEKTLIFPPHEEIANLLALAMEGDVQGIIEQTHRLANLNSQYLAFSKELQQLAKGFQVKKIREFLKGVGS